jgi:hypothetical protein
MTANYELERMQKKPVVGYFKEQSQYLPGGNAKPGYPVFEPISVPEYEVPKQTTEPRRSGETRKTHELSLSGQPVARRPGFELGPWH